MIYLLYSQEAVKEESEGDEVRVAMKLQMCHVETFIREKESGAIYSSRSCCSSRVYSEQLLKEGGE